MGVYKGDKLISEPQVLYSVTGNNTDGAMTQDAVTTELDKKINSDEVWYDSATRTLYIGVAQS